MDNKIKILILLILMSLTVNTVFASDMNDTLTLNEDSSQELLTKENNNTVLQASENFGNLYDDIHGSQTSEINLRSDYIYGSFFDLRFATGVPIERSVTINGNGHTIDGNNNARIFEITDDSLNVIIKDLVIKNGETSKNGGAISGKCTVINCTFINNIADNGGALYGPSAKNCTFIQNIARLDGGAIYVDSPDISVENCTFDKNVASRLGGAISINSVLTGTTISNSTFKNNKGQNGGSLSVSYSQNLLLSNSKFISNQATLDGGAIHYDFSLQNTLDNCYFENNIADRNGGAFTWILSNGNITNSKFHRNSAKNNGGAIYANVSNTPVMIERQILTDCNFTENTAINGGALYCGGFYRITDGTFNFINNSAKQNGGAVYCGNLCSFSDSLFLYNTAQDNGGALYCNNSCSIFGSKFINNTAKNNGGAISSNNHNFLFDNQFMNNSAKTGGAIYCNDYNTVSKVDFINNTAEYYGGAFYGNNYCLVYNGKFNNNTAYQGGAVYFEAYNQIGFSEFIRNYAYQGPAIYTDDIRNVINNTVFLINKQGVPSADFKNENYKLTLQLLDSNYFFNAVYSWFPLDCHNITYWNGTITTVFEPDTMGGAGINFTVEIYDSNNNLVKKEIRQTDNNGKLVYDYFDFDGGNYTFNVIHEDDDYYPEFSKTYKTTVGDFTKLQTLLSLAKDNGIVNLTRNFTYSIGYDTLSYLGVYSENLTIYGNGYTIDALNQPVSFSDYIKNITFLNCSFKNGLDFNLRGKNVLISDCNFENTGMFRCNNVSSCQIINCNFDSIRKGSYFSSCEFWDNNITIIKNSNFTNNFVNGASGAAINLRNNSYDLIIGCNFINNTDASDAGAIYGNYIINFNMVNCSFINNSAESDGGALVLNPVADAIINIDGCVFLNNTAKDRAGAIKVYGDSVIKNSVFLNNKAASSTIEMNVIDLDTISFNFEGQNDYINAIVTYGRLSFDNVTYWDGTVTNTNEKSPVRSSPGQNITIKAFDKNDNLIFQTVEKTDENGKLICDTSIVPYETKYVVCYHEDDAYYTRSSNVTSNVTRRGDFDKLQTLIDKAGVNGVVNLTRNYTYGEGFETSEYLYINYNNITVNGNGYSINFNKTGFIYINEANGITLNNIDFTGGESQDALMYIGGDSEINDCNFINNTLRSGYVIHLYKNDLTLNNTNFINSTGTALRVDDSISASIYNSNFINNTGAISAGGNTAGGYVASILISGSSFTNNSDINNDAALKLKVNNLKIENSNFTNNKGTDGGAINLVAFILNVTNSTFEGNIANNDGGAIYARTNGAIVSGCDFLNNSANKSGGAIYHISPNSGLYVENSTFRFNSADVGPAIYCDNGNLKNVTVLDNRVKSVSLVQVESTDNHDVVMKFESKTNYINAIYSNSINFNNVVYWNGEVVNSDDVYPVENQYSGLKITLEIYDGNDNLVDNVTLVTDEQNKIYYNLIYGENGNYTYKAYHSDDNYYSFISGGNGTFESIRPESSVNINIDDGAELYYSNCNISFDIINRTVSRILITNVDGSQVYINQTTENDYIIVDLDPSEDYYNIAVYNDYTIDYVGSHDSKLFKILKIKPSIIINPISDIYYNNEFNVTFDGENFETVNVTVFDVYGNVVFSEVSSNKYATIPVLPAGTYNITLTSGEDKYHSNASNSTKFNILKAHNNVTVSVDNVTYGNVSVIVVSADVDGVYTVNVNGTVRNVTVVRNVGKLALSLGVGKYYANVSSFEIDNYISIITNTTFEVYKAVNNVKVSVDAVVYGNVSVIVVSADVDGVYSVDVNGTIKSVIVMNKRGNFTLSLDAGKYYANVTSFDNGNYSIISNNAVFEVYKAINNIKVLASSVTYGNDSVIYVVADVDGVYTLDLNGNVGNINVVNGLYNKSVRFGAGKYYANVTFDNDNYHNIISNAVFEVYKAVNNVHVAVSRFSSINDVILEVDADVDGVYTLDFNGNISSINVVNGTYSISLHLAEGKYYANVTFENENYTNDISNIEFEISEIVNNVKVIVKSVTYGNESIINVIADVDGVYTLDLNGDVSTINVVNGKYSRSVRLGAGKYYANVTFDNDNYKNIINNAVFEVYKAVNNVYVIANSVTYGKKTVIYVAADVDGVYSVDVNGTIRTVNVVDKVGNLTLSLGVGRYYANVTFDNDNYSNVISNYVFRVYKAVNNVKVVVNSVVYGNDVVIEVIADADGVYTVDVNGTVSTINVVNGTGSKSLRFGAGKYYANVTFTDDANYTNIITNASFEVYKATNKARVSADSVVYGNVSVIVVSADVDGVYTVDVNGTIRTVAVVGNVGNFTLSLGAGKYYANVTFDNGNYSTISVNAVFEVYKAVNNVRVIASNVPYGNVSVIVVSADVDGIYTLDFNGNVSTIKIVNGTYSMSLKLDVGRYYVNVTFDNGNYSNVISNAVFEVYQAVNNVRVIASSVTYGNESIIYVVADVDGVYTLDVNGDVSTITVLNGTYSKSVRFGAGKYYANVTFDNDNYNNIITNAVFEVYKAVNNIHVFVIKNAYSRDVVLEVVADVDGVYTLDFNGNVSTIMVENGTYSTSLNLPPGKYYANVTFENANYSNEISNIEFEISKEVNNIKINAISVVYGNGVVLEVVADVDGVYTVDVNGTVSTINVVNGTGSKSLRLGVGKYYANVTFGDDNYNNIITNAVFEVYKAVNNVYVIASSVTYGKKTVIYVAADVDGVYTVDVNGTIRTVNVVDNVGNLTLSLGVGRYYANVTFENANYSNVISNYVFRVYKAVNNVKVVANSVVYGNDVVLEVVADVDGVYTLDFNGNVSTINVVNGKYSKSLRLGVGKYYANVTFVDGNYSTVVSNAVFEVYKAVNNVKVVASSVTYGNVSVIYVVANVDGVYTVDVNGTVSTINVVNGTGSKSLRLGVGKYYANVTFVDGNYSTVVSNAVFEVYKAVNNVKVSVSSVTYGKDAVIVVSADVDGLYTLDFNGNVSTIEIVNGTYSRSLSLGAGRYYANVTFVDGNYSTVVSNAVFEVYKAVNNVYVMANNVNYGEMSVIFVVADVEGVYNVDINGTVMDVTVEYNLGYIMLSLGVGSYYANVTFDNGNYSTVVSNAVFEVYKAVNNVKVSVNSVAYGKDVVLEVVADVDGNYTLDFNGNVSTIEIVDGKYSSSFRLPLGKYYANVTFDNGNYSTVVSNAVFEVYKAVNNVYVIVNSVTYGEKSVIYVVADVEGVYSVDVNGTDYPVTVVGNVGNVTLSLGVGRYYANVTFDNGNYSTVVSNAVFEVYKAVNNVYVTITKFNDRENITITVFADVDGVYTLDVNGSISTINVVNGNGSKSLLLPEGKYYVNVTFENDNYSNKISNIEFEINDTVNNVKVVASSVTYGKNVTINIFADVDGDYILNVNGSVSTINVVNGTGSKSLRLDVGKYYANVTFDNDEYINIITNASFEVYKALNNVYVISNSISYGEKSVIYVIADVEGVYSVDVNGTDYPVTVVDNVGNVTLSLAVGSYYANVTFDNGNYSTVVSNAVFEVYKALNNVEVSVRNVTYGDRSVIYVYADVDGVYTLDLDGKIYSINVVNGEYSKSVRLGAGKYYANVTFADDTNYTNIITNASFEVYKAVNNVQVIANSVSYGENSVIIVIADVDGNYAVDVNGTDHPVAVVGNVGNVTLFLGVGRYYANVTFENGNYTTIISNDVFEVYKAVNNVEVSVSSVTYGKDSVIVVSADVDGNYTLDLNGDVTVIEVVNGTFSKSLRLGAGKYYANVTFDNGNYSSVVSNAVFEVYKAVNNVYVIANSVTYGEKSVIYVIAVADGTYSVDVNGTDYPVAVVDNVGNFTLSLGAGNYYANATFDNGNYSTVVSNDVFEVYKAVNNVHVNVNSVTYGNDAVIVVSADVDGVYTLDLNGDVTAIEVVNGTFSRSLRLGAGKYYANVTFDNGNYSTVVSNDVFEVYKAVNNVHIMIKGNMGNGNVILEIVADVDGVYTLDLNGNVSTINVVNGNGSISLSLASGKYYTNVTFDNDNYTNEISNIEFEIAKAVNNIKVITNSVIYGNENIIRVVADVDGVYTLDVNGDVSLISVVNGTGSVSLRLGAGKYYANVTFEDGNYSNIITNAVFEVYKAENNVKIVAKSVTYGKNSLIVVSADVDGVYIVDVNGTINKVAVVNNKGNFTLSLGAGKYYANVTFDNGNYSTSISNAVFEVYKAVNNVYVLANSVTYGEKTVIYVAADVDGVYSVDVNGTIRTVNVVEKVGNFTLSLGAGKYYANVTFDNGNYTNIVSNDMFKVYKAVNNIKVIANSVIYGNVIVLEVIGDVDGVYKLDLNGDGRTINVVGGRYSTALSLGAGKYYANVTFDDENYSNIITNAIFEVYKAVNNVKVRANSVTFGNMTVINIYADVDGIYTLDVNGIIGNVNVVEKVGNFTLSLDAGKYYANVTFDNGNYSTIVSNAVFEVYKAVNNVRVIADSVVYGNEVVIEVVADVDGVYTLDVNGTVSAINVVNGRYSVSLPLAAGKYYAKVTFDDSNYSTIVSNAVFEVYKAVNNVRVIADSVVYGNDVVIEVIADVDGVYTLDVNGTVSAINVVNGRYSVSLSLAAGKYYAKVTFDNDNYSANITNAVFEVNKIVNNVKVIANSVVYGNDVVIEVVADVDGVYTLDLNGNVSTINVVNGKYTISLSLDVGTYYVNVSFNDSYYDSIISNAVFDVLPVGEYDMAVGAVYDDGVYVYIILPDMASGKVTLHIADKDYTVEVNTGIAFFTLSDLKPGYYNITVHYSGDNNYASKTSNITIRAKQIKIDAYDVKYGWNKSIQYSVKLIDEYGNAIKDKEVLFFINGKTFKSTTDSDGIATIYLSLNIGSYDIKVSYMSETVIKKITVVSRFSENININMYYFDGSRYTFKVYDDNGNPVGANEKVVIKLNKKTYTLKTDKNGLISFKIPQTLKKIGKYTIKATYKGQTIKNTVKVKQILVAKKTVYVKKTAKQLVLTAKLKKKLKGKTIIFKFKGKKYKTKTNKYGLAKVKINKKVISKLKKGNKYTVIISYYKMSIKTKVIVR